MYHQRNISKQPSKKDIACDFIYNAIAQKAEQFYREAGYASCEEFLQKQLHIINRIGLDNAKLLVEIFQKKTFFAFQDGRQVQFLYFSTCGKLTFL